MVRVVEVSPFDEKLDEQFNSEFSPRRARPVRIAWRTRLPAEIGRGFYQPVGRL